MAEKKYSVLAVLKVLQEYSDEEHPLLMKQIKFYVHEKYDIDISEKTIRSDIAALKSFGFDIRNKGSFDRTIEHGDGTVLDSKINKDWYLVGPISDQEIEILYDALLSEKYLSEALYTSLWKKLQSLSSSVGFDLNIKGAAMVRRDWADSEILYNNMRILREAIVRKKVVSFDYAPIGTYGSFNLNNTKHCFVSPRRVFNENGVYYLLGCNCYSDELIYIRIELIRNLEINEWKKYSIYGLLGKGLTTHKEFSYRKFKKIPDEYVQISFGFPKTLLNEAVDYFGSKRMAFRPHKHGDTHLFATVVAPEKAMLTFACMYAPEIEIMSPKDLRNKIRDMFSQAAELNKDRWKKPQP